MTATHFAKAKSALQVGKGEHGRAQLWEGRSVIRRHKAEHVKLEKLSNESIEWPTE